MGRRQSQSFRASLMDEAWMNLMPLIDVVFVVLIMFIVVAPMLNVDRVELAEGTTKIKEVDLKKDFSIYVREDNSIWLNQQLVTLDELQSLLSQRHQERPEATFQVFFDHRASFGTYQNLRTVGQKAEYESMDVILKPH